MKRLIEMVKRRWMWLRMTALETRLKDLYRIDAQTREERARLGALKADVSLRLCKMRSEYNYRYKKPGEIVTYDIA